MLNPSIVKFNNMFFNYYSGYNGEIWQTGLATSENGQDWKKYEHNPIISLSEDGFDSSYIAANGHSIIIEDAVYYYYQGTDQKGVTSIGLAVSQDGYNFEKKGKVLSGDLDWCETAVADPYVVGVDGLYYMYFLGQNALGVQRLGIAYSMDGLSWTKYPYPIMDVGGVGTFDEKGLGEPSIYYNAPYFYMLYTGRRTDEYRNIGLAISLDGINWKKMSTQGIISTKDDAWNSKVICDTTFIDTDIQDDLVTVYYGGGNVASSADHLNGQIGSFVVDLTQGRDEYNFRCSDEWPESVNSTDILKGSYVIEDSLYAWVKEESSIDLKNDHKRSKIHIKGKIPTDQYNYGFKLQITIGDKTVTVSPDKTGNIEALIRKDEIKCDYLKVKLIGSDSFIPKNDRRELSWMISSITQE